MRRSGEDPFREGGFHNFPDTLEALPVRGDVPEPSLLLPEALAGPAGASGPLDDSLTRRTPVSISFDDDGDGDGGGGGAQPQETSLARMMRLARETADEEENQR